MRGIVAALAASVLTASAAGEEKVASRQAVAVVGGVEIQAERLEALIQAPLVELRMREHLLRNQALEELIARELLAREAAARGISVEALESAEINAKATVSAAEVKAFYQSNRARFGDTAEVEALAQIEAGLRQQRQRERRAAFAKELRAKHGVKVLLEPFRLPIETADAPIRGNPKAPVTVVEFSDFQCPFCARARPTVNRIREVYGDRVRIVYRHFPLDFHPQAPKAGEAAACAGEQGKFWEMHDRLFANQAKLRPADLKEHAVAVGLDAAAFAQCLESGRETARVRKDAEEAARYGVTGTPAFFVNGRPVIGAQPYEAFAVVIDDELERLAGRLPSTPSP